ncbi:non-specific serine/threonine protein kinase [Trifolium repens]|nr:non-specific serine/threonine protein kinase [Trifolium repens]
MCNRTLHINPPTYMHNYTKCPLYDLYYQQSYIDDASRSAFTACANVLLPNKDFANADDPFTILTSDIPTEVNITEECAYCHFNQRGKCQIDSNDRFYCADSDSYDKTGKNTPIADRTGKKMPIAATAVLVVVGVAVLMLLAY